MTPDDAWTELGLDDKPFDKSPLDYTDESQKSQSATLSDGSRWAVVIRQLPA